MGTTTRRIATMALGISILVGGSLLSLWVCPEPGCWFEQAHSSYTAQVHLLAVMAEPAQNFARIERQLDQLSDQLRP